MDIKMYEARGALLLFRRAAAAAALSYNFGVAAGE
jgi:hypothetical protein